MNITTTHSIESISNPETNWLNLQQLDGQLAILMDNYEFSAKEFYELKKVRKEPYGWADYFSERALVPLSDYNHYVERLKQAETVKICLKTTKPQYVVDNMPLSEQIKRLDLSHNGWNGSIDLSQFVNLKCLILAGNPALSMAGMNFPSSLTHLVLTRGEQDKWEQTHFAQKTPPIVLSQNEQTNFDIQSFPFQDPAIEHVIGDTFWMGSKASTPNEDEKPRHLVQLSDYHIGKHPVTVAEFACFVNQTSYVTEVEQQGWSVAGFWRGDQLDYYCKIGCNWRYDSYGMPMDNSFGQHPVIHVTWNDAMAYCEWLSQKTGKRFCLPTEAQWEYAAMGGHLTCMRDKIGYAQSAFTYAGSNTLENVGWFIGKFQGSSLENHSTKPVGQLQPNELGLYDMSGHVWEWCSDWYSATYYQSCHSKGEVTNPTGSEKGGYRALRGGGWYRSPRNCRIANRSNYDPSYRNFNTGFRMVMV